MNTNLYENKSGHNEHIYFIIKLYENKPGHYKHICFNIKRYENKSGHYCNLGNDWSHWTLTYHFIYKFYKTFLVNLTELLFYI